LNLAEILLLLNFTFLVQIKKQGLLEPNTLLKFINLLVRKHGILEAKLYMMITDSSLTFMCVTRKWLGLNSFMSTQTSLLPI
jgi:hypothetical protein